MDLEKAKKRQSLKVIVSELIMVVTVVVVVAVLALVVSGYWINADFEVERQGMLQVSSVPTGANVNIDGESASWLQRTNTSKVLPSGEHTVTLTKDGYDTWSKAIDIKEGLLYRLHYPRLFLQKTTTEKLLDITGTTMATISPDYNSLLMANDTTEWKYIDLRAEKLEIKPISVANCFSRVSATEESPAGVFTGKILEMKWDYDSNHILIKTQNQENIEWALLDVKNSEKSINLTREFGSNFSDMEILDNSANNILAVKDGNLHRIDVSGKSISAVLAENIIDFDHYNSEVVYSAKKQDGGENSYYIGFFKIGDKESVEKMDVEASAKVVLSKFYDKKYITVLMNNKLTTYEEDDLSQYTEYELSFVPEKIKVGHNGEFIIVNTDKQIATLDMEARDVREWEIESEKFGWIDNDMIYTVYDAELVVYDFDGFNRRVIAQDVTSSFPAGITENKWLYYASNNNLMRKVIAD